MYGKWGGRGLKTRVGRGWRRGGPISGVRGFTRREGPNMAKEWSVGIRGQLMWIRLQLSVTS